MKGNILFFILIISFAFVSCMKDEPAPITPVEVTDLLIEASYTEADIQWNITSSASAFEAVVEYSTDSAFTKFEQKQMNKVNPQADDGQYMVSIKPLIEGTQYYVRCRAINKYSSYPSDAISIKTKAYHLPEVSTDSITAVSVSLATLHAQLLDWGTDTLPQVGFCFAKHAEVTIADSCVVCPIKPIEKKDSIIYSLTLDKLTDNTKYFVRAFARNHKGVTYGKELSFTTIEIIPPTVGNTTISNISYTTATAASEITADGGQTVTERGICYSTSHNPTTSNTKISQGSGTGSFTCNITGLTTGTKYYVRAYATNNKGTSYGNEVSFKTTAYGLPTITTSAASNISYTSATCGGNVTADGGQTVTERGVCYSAMQNPTISNTKIASGSGTGSFTCYLTGLTDGTTYYVRAYATNSKGTAYGDEKTFTTSEYGLPTLTTTAATNISYTTATCGGNITDDGGQSVIARGICYSTSQNPTISDNTVTSGNGTGSFFCNLTDLTAGTTYYVRAYAINSKGTAYGNEITLSTTEYGLPMVTTSAVTDITSITATCGGNVTADGGQTVTERGICYSTTQNPTIENSKVLSGSGTGSFTCNMTDLTVSTTYYVRAYATNSKGTAYGIEVSFNTSYPEGAIGGLCSVSATKQVVFSRGNLQYQAISQTWRFAENQYDMIGESNQNISKSYSGWIDLFGWGTGNNPTNSSTDYKNYTTFVDWGTNAISNGGNQVNQWRTLTEEEWDYLFYERPNAATLFGLGKVNDVNGTIILPDNWSTPQGGYFTPSTTLGLTIGWLGYYFDGNSNEGHFVDNIYTISQWSIMESAGAIFLPAAGGRGSGTSVYNCGYSGFYWSSTPDGADAFYLYFDSNSIYGKFRGSCVRGQSVRLVR